MKMVAKMSNWNPSTDAFGDCARSGCDEPCPWDMAAVMLGEETVCCSPACADPVLEGMYAPPEMVALHDPQGAADRDDLPNVADDASDIYRPVSSREDATVALGEIEAMYPGPFRVKPEERDDE